MLFSKIGHQIDCFGKKKKIINSKFRPCRQILEIYRDWLLSWEGSILKEIFQCKDGSKFELFLLGFDPQPIVITLTSISSTR